MNSSHISGARVAGTGSSGLGFAVRPLALAMALLMTGCAVRPPIESNLSELGATSTKPVRPIAPEVNTEIDTGYGETDAFILRQAEESAQGSRPASLQRHVGRLSVTESSVYDSLQLLAEEAGLSLSIDGGARAMERYGAVAMYNLTGTIERVLDKMSARIGFYWQAEDGMLVIEQERDFVLDLPPALADDSLSTLTNTLQGFGVKDVILDHQSRSVSFRANRRVIKTVEDYIAKMRATRSMIVYSVNIWQVDLTDGNQKGVDWNKFGTTYAKGSLGLVGGGVSAATKGLGMVFSNNSVSIDGILGYLETQGTVKTISQPRLAIISGTKGKLSVGQSTTYVSKVGSNVSSALSQVTVETQNLQTGLQMVLHGDVHDKTVYTRIHLSLADLLKMNKFTALGTDLNLPQTASRELETTTRVKPGDTIVLGGITINNDTADNTLSIANLSANRASARSELVIAIRPVLINFRGAAAVKPVAEAVFQAPERPVPPPMPIVALPAPLPLPVPVVTLPAPAVVPPPARQPVISRPVVTERSAVAKQEVISSPVLAMAQSLAHVPASPLPVVSSPPVLAPVVASPPEVTPRAITTQMLPVASDSIANEAVSRSAGGNFVVQPAPPEAVVSARQWRAANKRAPDLASSALPDLTADTGVAQQRKAKKKANKPRELRLVEKEAGATGRGSWQFEFDKAGSTDKKIASAKDL